MSKLKISQEIIILARQGETLKRIGRTGWTLAGVDRERQESVGEHSFGTILISLLISEALVHQGVHVDVRRVVLMAAIHDLPESVTSDIPRTAIELGGEKLKEGKRDAEKKVIQSIAEKSPTFGSRLIELWSDIENQDNIETRVVLGADIIDMLIHAVSLEVAGASPELLHQFFINSRAPIENLELAIIEDIFWDLYKEHTEHAKRQGITLKSINRD